MSNSVPSITEYSNQRILTTRQIAQAYETDVNNINVNFKNHKGRFTIGKHYFAIEGAELKKFKTDYPSIVQGVNRAPLLYLWTEKGAALHAKLLTTDKAWEFYESLVDAYFRLKEESDAPPNLKRRPINEVFYKRREHNKWLSQNMRFTVAEKTDVLALSGILNDLEFADNAFLDTSLGSLFYPWCKNHGYDMSLVRYTDELHIVGYKKSGSEFDYDSPIKQLVYSYPIDPFSIAWEHFLVQYYWPEKFLPYIKSKYKGQERITKIDAGVKVISHFTGKVPTQIKGR